MHHFVQDRSKTGRRSRRALPIGLVLLGWALAAAAGLAAAVPDRPSRAEAPLPADARRIFAKGSATDPLNDTVGSLPTQLDISGMRASLEGSDLVVEITFGGAIEPPNSGAANALSAFFIDLDTDQNGNTGDVPFTDFLIAGESGLGNEFYVESTGFSDTEADLYDDATDELVAEVPMSFSATSVTVRVPVALLGGDDGLVDLAAVVGTIDEFTDRVPNMGSVSSAPGDETIATLRGRFDVSVQWFFPPNVATLQDAKVSDLRTADSANFFFRNPNNLEFLIKVLDGCSNNGRFWVFFAGATNVGFTVTVVDRDTGVTKTYTNPPGQRADAVTDTQAFDTCP